MNHIGSFNSVTTNGAETIGNLQNNQNSSQLPSPMNIINSNDDNDETQAVLSGATNVLAANELQCCACGSANDDDDDDDAPPLLLTTNLARPILSFNNFISSVWMDFTLMTGSIRNFESMLLARLTCLAAAQRCPAHPLVALLVGEPATGKSFVMDMCTEMLPPGLVISSAKQLAATSELDRQHVVLMLDATEVSTKSRKVKRGQKSLFQFLLANNVICQRDEACKMMTGVFAFRGEAIGEPALAEFCLVIRPPRSIVREIVATQERIADGLIRARVVACLVVLAEQMIGERAIAEPMMDAFVLIWRYVKREMQTLGYAVTSHAEAMVLRLVRTLVVMKAVSIATLGRGRNELMFDAHTGRWKPFGEHYEEHFKNIEKLLAAELPEIQFGIALCSGVFGVLSNNNDDDEAARLRRSNDLKNILQRFGPLSTVCCGIESPIVVQACSTASSS